GIVLGDCIKKKGEKFEAQITGMDGSSVTVKDLKSGGVLKVQARDMLCAGWIVFSPKAEPESIASLQSMGPKKNNDFLAGYVIGEIYQVMHDLGSTHESHKDTAPEKGKHFLSANFLVGSCEDEESANMVQIMSGTAQSSIRIPMFKNSKEIGIGAVLNFLKVKQVEADEHAPKAKKAKTSKK
ncbi:unnamed protein product, partial [Symbiodinium sp. CCMP2456]